MNIGLQIFWIVISAIISFFVGFIIDILLPEKYRIKILLKKKKLSKFIKNPSYIIGEISRLDFKENIARNIIINKLVEIFEKDKPTFKGTELYLKNSEYQYNIDIIIQLDYYENEIENVLEVGGILITANSKFKYRDMRNLIDDLGATLTEVEKKIIRNFNVFPSKKSLFAEIESLEEFSDILEKLKAEQITGIIKNTNTKFAYYNKRLNIEGMINSKTIEWFKDIVAYVG